MALINREGTMKELLEDSAARDPFQQFALWQQQAEEAEEDPLDVIALATSSPEGRPSVRFVNLRGVDERGFVFYTNYEGRKGQELGSNPWGSFALFWRKCQRQVRVEGSVERISAGESDVYFRSRPRESGLETWASPQSRVIPDRKWLENRWQEFNAKFPEEPPRPEWWGGFRIRPDVIEFWQSRPYRMHDRLRYQKRDDGTWSMERLSP